MKHSTEHLNVHVLKQTSFLKSPVGNDEDDQNEKITVSVEGRYGQKEAKFCQMYDCDIGGDIDKERELFDNNLLKNPLLKNSKTADW